MYFCFFFISVDASMRLHSTNHHSTKIRKIKGSGRGWWYLFDFFREIGDVLRGNAWEWMALENAQKKENNLSCSLLLSLLDLNQGPSD
jgi:hypothetical protein